MVGRGAHHRDTEDGRGREFTTETRRGARRGLNAEPQRHRAGEGREEGEERGGKGLAEREMRG